MFGEQRSALFNLLLLDFLFDLFLYEFGFVLSSEVANRGLHIGVKGN